METDILQNLGQYFSAIIFFLIFFLYNSIKYNNQELKVLKNFMVQTRKMKSDELKFLIKEEVNQQISLNKKLEMLFQSYWDRKEIDIQEQLNNLEYFKKNFDKQQEQLEVKYTEQIQNIHNQIQTIKIKFLSQKSDHEKLEIQNSQLQWIISNIGQEKIEYDKINQRFKDYEQSQRNQFQLINQKISNIVNIQNDNGLLQQKLDATIRIQVQNEMNQQRQEFQDKIEELKNTILLEQYPLVFKLLEGKILKQSSSNLQLIQQVELVKLQTANQQRLLFQQKVEQQDLQKIQNQLSYEIEQLKDSINPISSNLKSHNTIITELYKLTINQSQVQAQQYKAFVNEELDQNELVKIFGMGSNGHKKTLLDQLRGMRQVRGGGNCFYTAFVFQYLQQIIVEVNDEIFNMFVEFTKELKFQITYQGLQITEQQLEQVKNQFIKRCQAIRAINQPDRMVLFCQYFMDNKDEYYGQAIIFMRSLAFNICDTQANRQIFQKNGLEIKFQLLEWEQNHYNSEQIIIQQLSKVLNLKIILFNCDTENKNVEVCEFDGIQNPKLSIYLLFRPGHYSIGLPKNN